MIVGSIAQGKQKTAISRSKVVGVPRRELGASCSQSRRATVMPDTLERSASPVSNFSPQGLRTRVVGGRWTAFAAADTVGRTIGRSQ